MALPIKEAHALVKATQAQVNEMLNSPEHILNLLEINTNFKRILNRMEFMGGILEPTGITKTAARKRFGPITSFMGEPIKQTPLITRADLTADEKKKNDFLAKVAKLYESLPATPTSTILNSYTILEDQTVLRGVAKRARVQGWKDRIINTEFVEDIKLGIQIVKEELEAQEEIDRKIREQDEKRAAGAVDDDEEMLDELDEDDVDEDIDFDKTNQNSNVEKTIENFNRQVDADIAAIGSSDINQTLPAPHPTTVPITETIIIPAQLPSQPILLTKELIAADPELKKAKPGQYLVMANGKKIIVNKSDLPA